MKRYITVDGGTTNTRVRLVCDRAIILTKQIPIGATKNINGNGELKRELKRSIEDILSENFLTESDIIRVLASGMITSEFGLVELPHVKAPADICLLHESMAEVTFPDICSIPFVFTRGIRVDSDILENVDIMRGEETEIIGIISDHDCIYVLPGSHSKIIEVDSNGKICRFSTMLTGEMISSLSQSTILKDAVDLSQNEFDEETLLLGYTYAKKNGLNNALFKTRVLKNILKYNKKQVYSFFIGAVLEGEIDFILSLDSEKIIIGGRKQIREAMATLLNANSSKQVITLDDDIVDSSTSLGMIKIFEYGN